VTKDLPLSDHISNDEGSPHRETDSSEVEEVTSGDISSFNALEEGLVRSGALDLGTSHKSGGPAETDNTLSSSGVVDEPDVVLDAPPSKCVKVISLPWIDLTFAGGNSCSRYDIPSDPDEWADHIERVKQIHYQRWVYLAPAFSLALFFFHHRMELDEDEFLKFALEWKNIMTYFAMLAGCHGHRARLGCPQLLLQNTASTVPAINITTHDPRFVVMPMRELCMCDGDVVDLADYYRSTVLSAIVERGGMHLSQCVSLIPRPKNECDTCGMHPKTCQCLIVKPVQIRDGDLCPYVWYVSRRRWYHAERIYELGIPVNLDHFYPRDDGTYEYYIDVQEPHFACVPHSEFAVFDIFEEACVRGNIFHNSWNTLLELPLSTLTALGDAFLILKDEPEVIDVMESSDEAPYRSGDEPILIEFNSDLD